MFLSKKPSNYGILARFSPPYFSFLFKKLLKKFDKVKYLCYTMHCEKRKMKGFILEKKGFIMKKQVCAALTAASILFTAAAAYADTGTITASTLNVRETPNSTVIGQLSYGQNVTVIGYENGWCQIQYDNKTGYIYGDYVSISPQEAAQAETEKEESYSLAAGQNIVEYAKNFIGVPYVYGGSSPSGFDCSGFVKFVYSYFGVSLPRTSYSQMSSGYAVSTSDLQPGDILVFRDGGHVGIYVGDGMYIHAPNSGRTVSIDPLDRVVTAARRIF